MTVTVTRKGPSFSEINFKYAKLYFFNAINYISIQLHLQKKIKIKYVFLHFTFLLNTIASNLEKTKEKMKTKKKIF